MSNENKKTVLVIDDDENLRLALTDKFVLEGFNVIEAKNGEEGLDKALKMHPDVILLDIMMPIMNGLDMLKKLKEDEWGKTAEVVILSVLENAQAIAEAMSGGSFSYLTKTDHSVKDIVDKVKGIISKK